MEYWGRKGVGDVHIATLQPANGAHGELHNGWRSARSTHRRRIQPESISGTIYNHLCIFYDYRITLGHIEGVCMTKVYTDSHTTDKTMFT